MNEREIGVLYSCFIHVPIDPKEYNVIIIWLGQSFLFLQYDVTPLGAAARNAPIDIVQVLLLYPFDVNGRNKVVRI